MAKKATQIEDVDTLLKRLEEMREAQAEFATFTQEQVDKIFYEAALAAEKNRIPLARMAVEETGMGVMEDKVIKNHYAAEYIYNKYKDMKTCGVVEEDPAAGYRVVAEPMGIVAAVIPTTNPTSTAIFKTLLALKTRNAIIISPHPRAKECTIAAARIVRDAAEKAGCPKGIIDWVPAPTIDMTAAVMSNADIILATGGPGMVNAAYSSGKPALGVGPGNTPAIIDDTADIKLAVSSIIHSKTFDNGMICASEQSVTVLDSVYDQVKKEFADRGCYFLHGKELDAVRKTVIVNGAVNAAIVGKSAHFIAKTAGVDVPEKTKILIGEVTSVEPSEEMAHEKLSPVLGMYRAKNFDEAIAKAERLVADGGYGHTSSLYVNINEKEKIAKHQEAMKTCRILINTPSSQGGIGDLYNFKMAPSLTLGCGSWGGNSVSGNVGPQHLLNYKSVAERQENMLWLRVPEKVYFKRGCMPLALRELKEVYNKKRVFIVTDQFLYKSGFTKTIEETLDSLGIVHSSFWDVAPDPTLQCALEGVARIRSFEPDCIIAIGGGSAMDAGKIMWLFYERPDADFKELVQKFMDIRKRTVKYPHLGNKAKFICVATTSGTGSEVTPFAVISDKEHGKKYPLADYALTPHVAIVDPNMVMTVPARPTASTGMDVLTHATEAYTSILANDYTDGIALQAIKIVFENLEKSVKEFDKTAREKMHNASCLAGMAFANAFLGICHSMAHKIGGKFHTIHGETNATLLPYVIRYNGTRPGKVSIWPKYEHYQAAERFQDIARMLGLKADTPEEAVESYAQAVFELGKRVGCPMSFKDHGVDYEAFKAELRQLSLDAYEDQCTPANPRLAILKDLEGIMEAAWFGYDKKKYEENK